VSAFFERLDALRSQWNVLEHSFYVRWSEGSLSREQLSAYAGEYRHAVVALAEAAEAAATASEPAVRAELEEHAAEEAAHVELWDEFARALGADLERDPNPETNVCCAAWTAGRGELENLVTLYTIESGQPAISQTKLEGLVRHYGFVAASPATEYFALHAERDVEHAAHSRRLIEDRLEGADHERLLEVAEAALKGNWLLLDAVAEPGHR
jgi:pyrroloquinoline-quinone synthase